MFQLEDDTLGRVPESVWRRS